jgi:hypothetical protein
VPAYDFNWQTVYELEKPLPVPRGTRIDCEARYDNSTANPVNPDPTKNVTFGNASFDEMMIGFVDYVVADGQRPLTAEGQVEQRLAELVSAHPGEVWSVEIVDPGDQMRFPSVLRLPTAGDGVWIVVANGQVVEGSLQNLPASTGVGGAFTAKLVSPIGTLDVSGTVAGDAISGTLALGQMKLEFAGHRVGG